MRKVVVREGSEERWSRREDRSDSGRRNADKVVERRLYVSEGDERTVERIEESVASYASL